MFVEFKKVSPDPIFFSYRHSTNVAEVDGFPKLFFHIVETVMKTSVI